MSCCHQCSLSTYHLKFNKIPYTHTLAICISTIVTGIDNQTNASQFTIETVVTNDLKINYKNVTATKLNFIIFDLQGKEVLSKTTDNIANDCQINIEKLAASVYIIKITNENNTLLKTSKFIKY
jgi:hypothetical protein